MNRTDWVHDFSAAGVMYGKAHQAAGEDAPHLFSIEPAKCFGLEFPIDSEDGQALCGFAMHCGQVEISAEKLLAALQEQNSEVTRLRRELRLRAEQREELRLKLKAKHDPSELEASLAQERDDARRGCEGLRLHNEKLQAEIALLLRNGFRAGSVEIGKLTQERDQARSVADSVGNTVARLQFELKARRDLDADRSWNLANTTEQAFDPLINAARRAGLLLLQRTIEAAKGEILEAVNR